VLVDGIVLGQLGLIRLAGRAMTWASRMGLTRRCGDRRGRNATGNGSRKWVFNESLQFRIEMALACQDVSLEAKEVNS